MKLHMGWDSDGLPSACVRASKGAGDLLEDWEDGPTVEAHEFEAVLDEARAEVFRAVRAGGHCLASSISSMKLAWAVRTTSSRCPLPQQRRGSGLLARGGFVEFFLGDVQQLREIDLGALFSSR